jgi:hypothetical protein
MKRDKDVLWIATPFNMRRRRRDIKDRAGASLARHQIHRDEPVFALEAFSNG